ncbi:spermatogenesis-associated protein 2-like protein [Tyto alba]|uniref:spermatogenesis-associated protein 2-like protein n=1 Tax=Tyto alba TaxID=56313 RepID=UPI001C66E15B|nr:spermatogenesis-associated protein 2-like protein [Tyto alba]
MCAGSLLRQEERGQRDRQRYRRCLEREFRRGRAGPCPDPSLGERLRREPAALAALQEDAPLLLARGLRDRPDPALGLRELAAAFRLLELAAVNLYLFPWRKEFGTVPTFTGAYVHSLRPALPEADLLRSFGRLGYERRDRHLLVLSRPPPGPELLAAACGFYACRLECEILGEVVLRLRPRRLRPDELLEARRLAGDVEACVEMLRRSAGAGADLYRETPTMPEENSGEDAAPPAEPARGWERRGDGERQPVGNPDPDPSCPEQELGAAGSPLPALGSGNPQAPGEPPEAPELPCYQLHSCLRRGALPSYCCTTCQQLHADACAAGQACRTHHRGQELRSERQQRLWLQRTEVDMLLADSSSLWS